MAETAVKQYVYSPLQREKCLAAFEAAAGPVTLVLGGKAAGGCRIDLCAARLENHLVIATCGMGAFPMQVPDDSIPARCELMIELPLDWNLSGRAEEDYWPLRWLRILARLPMETGTWLGFGHTIPGGGALAGNTDLSAFVLVDPVREAAFRLPGGEDCCFYQLLPLYPEELDFAVAHGAEALLEKLGSSFSFVTDIRRSSPLHAPRLPAPPPEEFSPAAVWEPVQDAFAASGEERDAAAAAAASDSDGAFCGSSAIGDPPLRIAEETEPETLPADTAAEPFPTSPIEPSVPQPREMQTAEPPVFDAELPQMDTLLCLCTRRITDEGAPVGYCYREMPANENDSGWRFTAGDESDEYMDDPDTAVAIRIDEIAALDKAVGRILEKSAPCAFARLHGALEELKAVV
ncbi:MAG: DUF2185 domain-containing protein [Oscillospiraceae bacterium]|jgi:hypothetical protein|nr:DUF2185 domain-containing protein [Oscillospiraceae bacterium]